MFKLWSHHCKRFQGMLGVQEGAKMIPIYGSVEIKQFNKFENGRMVSYSYSINRDRGGKELSRTKPMAMSSLGWDNGEPFTKEDYKELEHGQARSYQSNIWKNGSSFLGRISLLIKKTLETFSAI